MILGVQLNLCLIVFQMQTKCSGMIFRQKPEFRPRQFIFRPKFLCVYIIELLDRFSGPLMVLAEATNMLCRFAGTDSSNILKWVNKRANKFQTIRKTERSPANMIF